MKGVHRSVSNLSQHSYDFENKGDNEASTKKVCIKNSSLSRHSTSDSVGDIHEPYEDLYLLQELAFEFPEVESSLFNALSNVKRRNSFTMPAWFLDVVMAICHFLLAGASVFCIGLVTGFFMSSPTGYTGSFLWKTTGTSAVSSRHTLFVTDIVQSNAIHVSGTFSVSHYVRNPTLFTASLSSYVSVSYLPMANGLADLDGPKCLETATWEAPYQQLPSTNDGSDVLKTKIDDVFQLPGSTQGTSPTGLSNVHNDDLDKASLEEGTLITMTHIDRRHDKTNPTYNRDRQSLHVFDASIFNMFKSHLLLSNKMNFATNIKETLNEVSYLVSINRTITKDSKNYELATQLLRDCQKGNVLLQLESTQQSFKTMFFAGEMLPMKFSPILLSCEVTTSAEPTKELKHTLQTQRLSYIDQYNILLNMDTMHGRHLPLLPPEQERVVTAP